MLMQSGTGTSPPQRYAWLPPMTTIARALLFFVALAPVPVGACVVVDPLDAQIARALKESSYVFLARVGSTTKEASPDERFGFVQVADLTVLEVFAGNLMREQQVPMRLGQPKDAKEYWPAFAWEGDLVLIYADSLPVSEESFFPECRLRSRVVGNLDRPRLDDFELESLRKAKGR